MPEFQFPPIYLQYPPLFTRQPAQQTLDKQLEVWSQLVLDYCKHHRLFSISIKTPPPRLFDNSQLKRKCSQQFIKEILDHLVQKRKQAIWSPVDKSVCHIMWRTVDEWSAAIVQWSKERAFLPANSILTCYELFNGDLTVDEEFHGLKDRWLLAQILGHLKMTGRCGIMVSGVDSGSGSLESLADLDEVGIKFL